MHPSDSLIRRGMASAVLFARSTRMFRLVRNLGRALGLVNDTPLAAAAASGPPLAEAIADVLGKHVTTVLDVGARWGMDDAWYRIRPLAKLVGFEPDPDECGRLNRQVRQRGETHHYYVPKALGSHSGPATLYLTKEPACSSLYRPDQRLPERFPALEVIRLIDQRQVMLTTLEAWAAAEMVDEIAFVKLDTQGAELDILRGAGPLLDSCLGVEVEVEFNPIYAGQPLFADVDAYLRGRGFSLWRLSNMAHYSGHPGSTLRRQEHVFYDHTSGTHAAGSGRLTWANAIYFRDPREERTVLDGRQLLLLAALFDAAGEADAAGMCLDHAGSQGTALKQAAERLRAA